MSLFKLLKIATTGQAWLGLQAISLQLSRIFQANFQEKQNFFEKAIENIIKILKLHKKQAKYNKKQNHYITAYSKL